MDPMMRDYVVNNCFQIEYEEPGLIREFYMLTIFILDSYHFMKKKQIKIKKDEFGNPVQNAIPTYDEFIDGIYIDPHIIL